MSVLGIAVGGTARAFARSLKAEALKAAGLPGVQLGAVLTLFLPVALAYSSNRDMPSLLTAGDPVALNHLPDAGIDSVLLGTVGVVVLATCVMVSEYTRGPRLNGTSRQVSTTMLVAPRRGACVAAKLAIVLAATAALLALAAAAALTVTWHELGPWALSSPVPWRRLAGMLTWWIFNATASMALAAATRNSLVSMTALIACSSLVSPGALLLNGTDIPAVARLLPDTAAFRLMMSQTTWNSDGLSEALSVPMAATVCAAWVVGCTTACCWTWMRRDA